MSYDQLDRDIKIAQDLAALTTNMTIVIARLDKMERELADMTAMANRWKGMTVILLGIGSVAGYFLTWFSRSKGLL